METKRIKYQLSFYTILLVVLWTLIIVVSFLWNRDKSKKTMLEFARVYAHATYKNHVLYRSWNAQRGGVYVFIDSLNKPNKYLEDFPDRDLETTTGKKLTLINPAYMTRQVFELERKKSDVISHITSLKLKNPNNKADPWEELALKSFEKGSEESITIDSLNGQLYYRMMHPLFIEKSCLKRHDDQGYKINDVSGGISISIPLNKITTITKAELNRFKIYHLIVWLLGLFSILISFLLYYKNQKNSIKAIKELEDSEKRFRGLYENAPVCYQSLDKNTCFLDVNKAWLQTLGYKKEEVLGKPFASFMVPESAELVKSRFPEFVKKGELYGYQFDMVRKDGHIITVAYNGKIGCDINGYFKQTHCVFSDITEQKHQEILRNISFNINKKANHTDNLKDLLKYIQEELSKIIDTKNFYVALKDIPSGKFMIPYIVDDFDKDYITELPEEKSLTRYVIKSKKSLFATKSKHLELIKEGHLSKKVIGTDSKIWVGVPIIDKNECIGVMAIQSYTDEKAYTQKDLKILEFIADNINQVVSRFQDYDRIRLLNKTLTQSPNSIIITNTDGDIEYVNPAFTSLSGFSFKEVYGNNPRLLKSGEQPLSFYKNLWDTILSGKVWEGEIVNKRKDGTKYLVNVSISPVYDKDGKVTHFVGIAQDITEKRKLERDFIHAFVDAQEVEKQSFGEELHDGISQILAAESMFITVLKKLNNNSNKEISKNLDKLNELNLQAINEARNIAHGLMSKQLKEKGLILAVEHICKDYNVSKKVKFNFSTSKIKEAEINPQIKTNIFRIIQEITTNSLRHSLAKNVYISIKKTSNNQIQVIVKDDGVGIDYERIKANNKGAGLKNIERRVKLLNGTVVVKTAPNEGTQYTILVPLKDL
ncbi:MAG: PAS domain S-box protein [Flavobacteriaceae bacterium]|nr:PAS domain S-box protein [Flavobacteriaceae bacterium]